MNPHTVMLYVNLAVGAAAFTIYGLWAGKWLRRKAPGLFFLNLLTAIGVGGFVLGYANIVIDSETSRGVHVLLRYIIPIAVGLPVWARVIEYRRDEKREDYARDVLRELQKRTHDGS